MLVGLVLQGALVVVAYVDRAALANHVRAGYPGYSEARVDSAVIAYLTIVTTVGVLGVLCWIAAIWAVRARKTWDIVAAGLLLTAGTGTALYGLLVEDTSGEAGLPALLGWLGVLPCMAGLVAVVLLASR